MPLVRARSRSLAAPRRGTLLRLVGITVLLAILAMAPSVVAETVTGPEQPRSFLTRPVAGWSFAATVLRHAPDATAASPGDALELARRHWGDDSDVRVVRTSLVYVDDSAVLTVPVLGARPARRTSVQTSSPLAWLVTGSVGASRAEGVVGVLDYESGDVRYDIRGQQPAPKETR